MTWATVGLAVAVTVAVAGCQPTAQPPAVTEELGDASRPLGPRLTLEPRRFTLTEEEVTNGQATRTFVIRNGGDQDLTVRSVTVSCDCTTAALGVSTLRPAEQTELVVKIRPDAYRTGYSVLRLVSNDREAPESLAEVAWAAAPPLVMMPTSLDFGTVGPGESVDRMVTFERVGEMAVLPDAAIPVDDASAAPASTSVGGTYSLEASGREGYTLAFSREGASQFRVTLTAGERPGDYVGAIHALDGETRVSMANVRVAVRANHWTEPSSLGLLVPPGRPATRRLVVRGFQDFEIVDVSSEPSDWLEAWHVEPGESSDGHAAKLTLKLHAANDGRGAVRVRVRDHAGDDRDLTVPVTIVFTRSPEESS